MAEDRELHTADEVNSSASVIEDEQFSFENLGFTGNYKHGLDAKGRLIIPASFREGLGKKFAVCLSPDFKTIALYPLKAWVDRRNEYIALCAKDATMRRILNQFTKYSYVDSEMDLQGRLLLPSVLRKRFLDEIREVDVNGSYDHIVVEASVNSDQEDEDFARDFEDVLSAIAKVQRG